MAVDTARVPNRQKLHFETIGDIAAEVERLNKGPRTTLGNWSDGQILKHLAIVMDSSIDGATVRFAWPLRILGRLLKRRVLTKGMTPGFQIKGQAAEVLVPGALSWDEGLAVFRESVRRQQTETKRAPSPFLGSMTREEWDRLHCRHAELHLSFIVPASA